MTSNAAIGPMSCVMEATRIMFSGLNPLEPILTAVLKGNLPSTASWKTPGGSLLKARPWAPSERSPAMGMPAASNA